ncbi:glycerol-3-phosphate acyltransferase [Deinococcus wulumuqiensis]|uniref:glycerol-3-phosphate acyltransferase n=1 Tax=Deinococcus wulumuqiensis TaxID=980427 RepID=UPI0003734D6C|nr:glycerol-3-phosphate acyltransferase [Deinococcus wulumuqiensis]QII21957.1 hypothetical protein G6R31_13510 [Deinococcus wulumuqiensis R12]
MRAVVSLAVVFVLSYLLGSLVAGVLYSRRRGEDIRGRDLPGGSGTYRQYGPGAAVLVTALDVLKGVLAAGLALWLAPQSVPLATALATFGVVFGHCYPAFFGFRGGGGIAPFLGAMLVTAPWTLLVTVASALALIPLYRATLQPRLKLNAIPFVTALAVPVGALVALRLGGLAEFLAGSAAMGVRAAHLLAEKRA